MTLAHPRLNWPTYRFGAFELDPLAAELRRDGRPLRVQRRVFDLLLYLIERRDRVVSREELLAEVWQGVHVEEASLYQAVAKARRLLATGSGCEQPVELLRGRGYRFVPPVSECDAGSALFVGRAAALGRLAEALDRARAGSARVVFVTGEAGIGKTALVERFLARARSSGDLVTVYGRCVETYGGSEAYRPLLEAITELCRDRDGRAMRKALERSAPTWLARLPALVDPGERARLDADTRGADRPRMVRELTDAVAEAARERPLVLVIEDLQWSDPSTLDAVRALATRGDAPLLVLATARTGDPGATSERATRLVADLERAETGETVELHCLEPPEVAEYVAARLPGSLPPDLVSWLLARSGGNPLFLSCLIADLIERGALVGGDDGPLRLAAGFHVDEHGVPRGVRDLVDRQVAALRDEERDLVEVASVAGGECCSAVLAAGVERDWRDAAVLTEVEERANQLARRSALLVGAGLEEWPDGTLSALFRFTHDLQREAVYDALPAVRRARLHRRIAECLEKGLGEAAAGFASGLAHHFARGRQPRRALDYLVLGLHEARERCARDEALGISGRALELIGRLPAGDRQAAELRVRVAFAPVLARAPAHPQAERNYERGLELCSRTGDESQLGPMLWGLAYFAYQRGHRERAFELSERLYALGVERGEADWVLLGRDSLGRSYQAQCDMASALPHADFVWRTYDSCRHRRLADSVGQDIRMNSGIASAFAFWELGRFGEARARMLAVIDHVRALGHSYSAALALIYASTFFHSMLDRPLARAIADEAGEIARSLGIAIDAAFSDFVRAACDEPGEARMAAMFGALGALQGSGEADRESSAGRTTIHILLAQELVREGQRPGALASADAGLALVRESGDRTLEPGLRAMRGLALDDPDEAEAELRRALAVASEIHFRLTRLRAVRYLARHLGAHGRRDEARALLLPELASFGGELEVGDLWEARDLLRALEADGPGRIDPLPAELRPPGPA